MHDKPERIVRRFAAAGNLVVSGKPAAVIGAGTAALAMAELLERLGAVSAPPENARIVYADGDTAGALAPALFAEGSIIVETGLTPAVDVSGLAQVATRSPFVAYQRPDGTRITVLPVGARRTVPSDAIADAESRLRWARDFMPACAAQAQELAASGVVRGARFGISMVLEPKTATLALFLRDAGAEVVLYAHADETDPAIADVLRAQGFTVHASTDERDQLPNARAFLAEGLDFLLDDGAHLIRLAELEGVTLRGAAEETTSGLRPLRAMGSRLRTPVVAVNDARMKTRFDNRYGTGQSCVFAIADLMDSIDRTFAGSLTAVIGFGPVGEGVAQHARALGATVAIVEHDPVRALEAQHAGYRAITAAEAAAADIIISATGEAHTVPVGLLEAAARAEHAPIFAVAGGVIDEIELDDARAAGAIERPLAPKVDAWDFAPGSVVVLDRGGCINITAAEGNPVEIMDYSFAAQLAACRLLASGAYPVPGVHPLPAEEDQRIAAALLGMTIVAHTAASEEGWHPTRFPEAHSAPAASIREEQHDR